MLVGFCLELLVKTRNFHELFAALQLGSQPLQLLSLDWILLPGFMVLSPLLVHQCKLSGDLLLFAVVESRLKIADAFQLSLVREVTALKRLKLRYQILCAVH